ncbi:MAG: TAXI family TRAP transporter solute-binding subunit [Xanthobacteraceae bacterium]
MPAKRDAMAIDDESFMGRIFGSIYWHPTLLRALGAIICLAGVVWLIMEYFNPALPSTITIATGPKGGAYEFFAQQYQAKLARAHVRLDIRITEGTSENIRLLEDPKSGVQVAFVVGGASNSQEAAGLLSLGRVNYQVFWLFYRGTGTLDYLTQLKGKRIGVGPEGVVTTHVLDAAGVNSQSATLLPFTGSAAVEALLDGQVDAIFLALASESSIIQPLVRDPNVRLMSVSETDALTRIFPYLVRLVLPQGVIDLEHNIPPNDVNLIGTTNAVVVREDLHPAIIDLLAKTLVEVHSGAGIFQRVGEFPTQTDPEFAMANGAREFYKNGPSYLNKYLSYGTVSLIKKIIAVILSCALVLVPFSRIVPNLSTWVVRDRMRDLYRRLRLVEAEMQTNLTAAQLDALQSDLDRIEQSANHLGVPIRHSDLFFELKTHINLVRQRLGSRRAVLQSEIRKIS